MSKGWWCPNCKVGVPSVEVTFEERHEFCGHGVIPIDDIPVIMGNAIPAGTTIISDAELDRLQAIERRVKDVEGGLSDVIDKLMNEEHSPISFAAAVSKYALEGGE